jgi:membrane fusion protein, multidrug efflux system
VRGVDDEYQYQRDYAKIIADSDLDVQKAKVMMDQAQVEFDAQEKQKQKNAGQEIEWARAKATLAEKKVEHEIAKLQWDQQKVQLRIRQAQLDRLSLKAPFDGTIDNVGTDVGEVKRETEPVLKIVATDPLWMDVNASTPQTILLGLKPGDRAWVLLELPGEPAVYEAKVIEVAAEANFEANERRVRVELANPKDWPAGIAAWVRFTPPEGEWAKRVTKTGEKRADASHEGSGSAAQAP